MMRKSFVPRDRRTPTARLPLLSFLLGVSLIGACAPPVDDGTAAPSSSAILLPVPDDPTVSFTVWFEVGSQNDPPGKEGLAALTGEMLASAATANNSYDDVLAKLYPLASSYQVRIDKEMTTLTGRTHVDNVEIFYSLFTDAYLRPGFNEDDFKRLKNNQLNYLKTTLRYNSDEDLGKTSRYTPSSRFMLPSIPAPSSSALSRRRSGSPPAQPVSSSATRTAPSLTAPRISSFA